MQIQLGSLLPAWERFVHFASSGQLAVKALMGNSTVSTRESGKPTLSRLQTIVDKWQGTTLSWQDFQGSVETSIATCTWKLDQGQVVANGLTEQPGIDTDVDCVSSKYSMGVTGVLKLSAYPLSFQFNRRGKLRSSLSQQAVSFDEFMVELTPVPVVKFRNVTISSPRIKLGVDQLEVREREGEVYASFEGGGIDYLKAAPPSQNVKKEQRPSMPARANLPKFNVDWFNATVSIDGRQFGQLEQLTASNNSLWLQLKRGDSSVSVIAEDFRGDLRPRTLELSGHLELEDIDMLW